MAYIKGIGESCKNICSKLGTQMHFKGGRTIKDLLVKPKDRDTVWQKSRAIYRYKCGRVDCEEEYTGESGRTFAERCREHMKAPLLCIASDNYSMNSTQFSTSLVLQYVHMLIYTEWCTLANYIHDAYWLPYIT